MFLDKARLQAYNWGGDPYNNARLDIEKKNIYRFQGTYSNVAYFNNVPSFANLGRASNPALNQRAYDTSIRNFDGVLELFPTRHVVPYLGFLRNSSTGWGVTPLVLETNEYPLRDVINWRQDTYRGGVRFEFNRFHGTLEEGGTFYKDDQTVYAAGKNYGNRANPYLGQQLFLNTAKQLYYIRGQGPYTKAMVTTTPADWIDLYIQYLHSSAKTKSTLNQDETGLLAVQTAFYTGGVDLIYGDARMPRDSGSFGTELRIKPWLRFRETLDMDKFRSSSSLLTVSTFTSPTQSLYQRINSGDHVDVSRNTDTMELIADAGRHITLRGGFRHEWGASQWRAASLNYVPTEQGRLQRNVYLGGLVARAGTRFNASIDVERGETIQTYYRTGLYDTYKLRTQLRYGVSKDLRLHASYMQFTNRNNVTTIDRISYRADSATGGAEWRPRGSRKFMILADYNYSAIHSDVLYLLPAYLLARPAALSAYRDYAHTGTGLIDMVLPITRHYSGRLTAGGSWVHTTGLRQVDYYQPQGRIQLPVTPKFEFFSEWRWYGLTQPQYVYEGFRTHIVMTGLRLLL
jgi:hypothetical protein